MKEINKQNEAFKKENESFKKENDKVKKENQRLEQEYQKLKKEIAAMDKWVQSSKVLLNEQNSKIRKLEGLVDLKDKMIEEEVMVSL